MKKLLRERKGNFQDVAEYLKVALAFGLVVAFMLVIINGFDDKFQSSDESIIPNVSKEASTNFREATTNGLDYLFLFGTLLFFIFSIVSARLIPSSPIFIIVAIAWIIGLPFVAMFIENIWGGFYQQTLITSAMSGLIFIPFMLNNLVIISIIYSSAIAISLLTKEGGL